MELFEYKGALYPDYLKRGNACRFIAPIAHQFCRGNGVDVGANKWPLVGATPVDTFVGNDHFHALSFPGHDLDYVFSSHCLEHLADPIAALGYWMSKLRPGGVLFLYLPHPEMRYWLPQHCRKHLHIWEPSAMATIVRDLGYVNVIYSERDLAWSFAVVGYRWHD